MPPRILLSSEHEAACSRSAVAEADLRERRSGPASLRNGGAGRIRMTLIDRPADQSLPLGRSGWSWCRSRCWIPGLAFEPRASALRSILRDAEIDRVADKDPVRLTAWELSMRALPMVMAADPAAHRIAIELLEKAMELAPRDPVPMALCAWGHGLRAGHHFTSYQQEERDKARRLASDASALSADDPLANTMLSAAYMLAHDLAAAEAHARRALTIDGGSAWGWGRRAQVHAYRGDASKAIK